MNDIIPREPTRADFVTNPLNPFAGEVTQRPTGALAQAEQQRSIAEVQARMIIARANPRNQMQAMDDILRDCTRPALAEKALYQYARGGTSISGPSIRLAEAIAQRWGNIASGIKELSRTPDGYSECVAYAWDLQSGFYDERQYQVRHWRDTKGGGYRLTDERDIYELIANMGQRRKRAVLLTVIPGDVVEAAQAQCEETLKATADTSPEALAKIVAAFGAFGVTKAQIEKRCQCRLEAIRPAQIVQLRKIYASLNDEMSSPSDWFETNGAWDGVEAQHAASKPSLSAPDTAERDIAGVAWDERLHASSRAKNSDGTWRARRGMGSATEQAQNAAPASVEAPEQPETQASASPPPETAGAFSEYLINEEGTELADGDGVIEPITDPMAFVKAYADVRADMFPADVELFDRANHDALAKAQALAPGAAAIIVAARGGTVASSTPAETADPARVFAPPAKPTKADYDKYKASLEGVLAGMSTPDGINRAVDLNDPVYGAFPPSHRLACKALVEARQKAISPPPARGVVSRSPQDVADSALRDIAAIETVGDLEVWQSSGPVKAELSHIELADPVQYRRVKDTINARLATLMAPKPEATGSLFGDEPAQPDPRAEGKRIQAKMLAALEACQSRDDVRAWGAKADTIADGSFLASNYPDLWKPVQDLGNTRHKPVAS